MERRTFLAGAAAAGLAAPLAAEAQRVSSRIYRIGIVSPTSPSPRHPTQAFKRALEKLGYVEGRDVIIEMRFAEGRSELLPGLIAETLRVNVDVLVVGSTVAALAAKRATTTVPIVFAGLIDPVEAGIVASLAHPGGNITGATFGIGGAGFAGKWVELLKEAVPTLSHVAVLWNATNPAGVSLVGEIRTAARPLNLRLDIHDSGNRAKLEAAFAAIDARGAQALIVTADPFFAANSDRLVRFAATKRLPAVYFIRDFVDGGGLMAYGGSLADSYRRAAVQVDKILKGAKPADLPVDQPTTFELVINLKTAKALGLTIPPLLLARADQVIE